MNIIFRLEQDKTFRVYQGSKFWYERGRFHRLSGPAIEYPGGYKYWWENGRRIRREEC